MVKLYVRIAKTALGWQKMPFRGVRWGLGASHTSAPITLTWSDADGGVFHSITRYQHSVILISLNRDIYCFIP